MRFLLLLFIALAAGIALTILVENPGYVLITREPWSFETSLTLFAVGLFLAFISIYLLVRLLKNLLGTPTKVRRWQLKRHHEHAIEDTRKGLLDTICGNWGQAEKRLSRSLNDSPQAEINLLAKAWIAQQKMDYQKRDDYIAEASNLGNSAAGDAEMAIGLAQCMLQEQAGQTEHALATARMIHNSSQSNPAAIKILLRLLDETKQWQELLSVLTVAKRHHVLTENEQMVLETHAATELLASSRTISDLQQSWKILPKKAHKDIAVIASYCRSLKAFDQDQEAETLLRNTLKHQWSEQLVEIYGVLKTDDPGSQLKQAELWLTEHPTNTQLMLCMGRLAVQNKLWGMARSFLEVAVQNGDNNEAFLELAHLLESLKEHDSALQIYKRGLEKSLSSKDQEPTPPPGSGHGISHKDEKIGITEYPVNQKQHEPDPDQKIHTASLAYSNESK